MPETNYRLFQEWDRIAFHLWGQRSSHLSLSPVMGTRQGASCLQSCACRAQGTADDPEKEAPFSVLAQIL